MESLTTRHRTAFECAVKTFNAAGFFEAHEALEDLWREFPPSSPAKKHMQGLVQMAVAFHHESHSNLRGAKSVLDRALRNLAGAENSFPQIDMEGLRRHLSHWQEYLAGHRPRPVQPQIILRNVKE